ncbi:MAG: extracellular solute-binding protein, partial [Planctomycetota bacterium]
NLPRSDAMMLEILVFQRGGGYFDAEGKLTMDSQLVLDTLLWYVPLASGKKAIAKWPNMFGPTWVESVRTGSCLFFFCPDWKSKSTEDQVSSMAGKMKLMPLPAWTPGGRRTSTWGGTMLGITKACEDKEAAWKLAQHLYTDKESIEFLFKQTNILPPFKWAWDLEVVKQPNEYWSGQRLGAMYAELAPQVPPQYSSPYVQMAKTQLGAALSQCVEYYEANQDDPEIETKLRAFAANALKTEADYVRRYMERSEILER